MNAKDLEYFVSTCQAIYFMAADLGMSCRQDDAYYHIGELDFTKIPPLSKDWIIEQRQLLHKIVLFKRSFRSLQKVERTPLTMPEAYLEVWKSLYKEYTALAAVLSVFHHVL